MSGTKFGGLTHEYECTIDPTDTNRMDYDSAPGEPVNGTASGAGSLSFYPDVFGPSCTAKLKVPADFGTAPIGTGGGGCPSGQFMCQGSCCPKGCVCDSIMGCSCD